MKRVRRRPAAAAAAVLATVAGATVLGALAWIAAQRATVERAVLDDVAQVVALERAADWHGARNLLERAKTRLGAAAGRQRLGAAIAAIERELDLVDRLAAMHLDRAATRAVGYDSATWSRRYREAFTEAGLLRDGDSPEAFAARLATSAARTALVGALDTWLLCKTDEAECVWLLRAAQRSDPDPVWRDKVRDLAALRDREALEALAVAADVADQPVTLLLTVAGCLMAHRSPQAVPLLRRIHAAHPGDFWANFALGEALDRAKDIDAIGYYRAAVALRPAAAAAHFNLAMAFDSHDRFDDAIACMQRVVQLDPDSTLAHYNLSAWFGLRKDFARALGHARAAVRTAPENPQWRKVLAEILMALGRFDDAAEELERAIERAGDDKPLVARLAQMLGDCDRTVQQGTDAGR